MNVKWMAAVLLGLASAASAATAQPQAPALKSEKEIRSYALGVDFGNQLRRLALDVDPAVFAKGLGDALAGGQTLLTDDELKAAVARVQAELKAGEFQSRTGASDPKKAEENKKAGEAFLAENRTKAGVVALPSGLQYKILTAGTGRKPIMTDTVICNYRGTLVDGTEFDSSYRRNAPATFPVKGVILGWTEALLQMPVGSRWQIVVPPELAYGGRGAGDKIGPNATLVFEIELIGIK
jgi:FKBP-type peptidyl-prolyl cis-trans isomerase FklB